MLKKCIRWWVIVLTIGLVSAGEFSIEGGIKIPFKAADSKGADFKVADSAEKIDPPKVGTEAPNASVYNQAGAMVRLTELFSEKPTVLVFYRGGWCPYCVRHLAGLQEAYTHLKALGYQLVAISPDGHQKLNDTAIKNELDYILLGDPEFDAIQAFGLAFRLDEKTVEAYKKYGIPLSSPAGMEEKVLPVPAVFLVSQEGKVLYVHHDPDYTRRLDPQEVVSVAREHAP